MNVEKLGSLPGAMEEGSFSKVIAGYTLRLTGILLLLVVAVDGTRSLVLPVSTHSLGIQRVTCTTGFPFIVFNSGSQS